MFRVIWPSLLLHRSIMNTLCLSPGSPVEAADTNILLAMLSSAKTCSGGVIEICCGWLHLGLAQWGFLPLATCDTHFEVVARQLPLGLVREEQ